MALGDKSVRFDIEGKNKTTKAFKQVNSSMSKLTGAAAKLGAALVGAFAVRSIVAFGKETLFAADAIGKFADRAGISTSELQKMRFAFDLAGVGVEAVDKGLLNFGKRLGKAEQGIGALVGGLKNGEEALLEMLLATENQSEALDVIFRAMGAATTQRRKLAIADAAFGMSGLRMTAAFRDGADSFFELKKEAESLGVVLEESMIRKSEELNDQMNKVSKVIKTNLMMSFSGLFPVILDVSNAILDFSMKLRGLSKVSGQTQESLSAMLLDAKNKVSDLEDKVLAMNRAFGPGFNLYKFLIGLDGQLDKARTNVKRLEKAIKEIDDPFELKPLTKGPEEFDIDPFDTGDPDLKILTLLEVVEARMEKIKPISLVDPHDFNMLEIMDKKRGEMFAEMEEASERELRAKRSIERSLNLEQEFLKLKIKGEDEFVELMERQLELENELGRALSDKEVGGLREHVKLVRELNKQLEFQNDLAGIGERVVRRMSDGWIEALQRGENAFESFKNVALAALFDIGQEMFRIAAIEPLVEAGGSFLADIGKAVAGSFFGGGGGGGGGGTTDFDVEGFAHGGRVRAGGTYLVGERGPELFSSKSNGAITPNNQLGGSTTNVTLNFSTGIQSTVRAEVMGLMPVIVEQVKAAVAESRQRGGSFSSAMGF